MAHALWYLGYPQQAVKRSEEALALGATLSHPFSLATAIHLSAYLHHFRREVEATERQAEAGLALATEQGFAFLFACLTRG